jgi:dipeptidyl aminopeptidase/acylaminoacyl peptidase
LDNTTAYRLPPEDVVDIIDAKPTPVVTLSPERSSLLLVDYEAYPSIGLLARPFLKLGGIRVDPALSATQRTVQYTGLTLVNVADGEKRPVRGLPPGAKIAVPSWSIDGQRFAFTRDTEQGVELWVGDVPSASCRAIPGVYVTDVLAGPLAWMDDSRRLLVTQVPPGRVSAAPQPPRVPTGPVITETAGKNTKAATYQDLLQDPHDERLFEYYGTSQLAIVDSDTERVTPLGRPDLYLGVRPSPDENYLLVMRLKRPFSYRVPYFYFARTLEVWDAAGNVVRTIADLPVSDEVPQQGVPTGPRGATWQQRRPATLLWVEALDGGDPLAKVPHREKVMMLAAPFTDEPRDEPHEVLRVTHRYTGFDWTDRTDEVLLSEYDRDRRWRTTHLLNLTDPQGSISTLFDLSVNDVYDDPGSPVYQIKPDGMRTLVQDGDWIYLAGRGATPAGDRPFLDRMNLQTREKERLFRSDDASYEAFVAFVDGDGERSQILMSFQTKTLPNNYFVHDLKTDLRRALTDFTDPHPQITGLKKEIVKYERKADGVPLSGTLYLPPGYDPATDGRLPLVVWAYPQEFSDAATAGQVRGSANTFTRLAGTSPLWFVTQGYAVLDDATVPVVGDPETMNDTFVEQIVGAAQAAIDEMVTRGIADPERVLVGGHSYGAFMTANLLAHAPGLFAAGIARSGAYNRTLTPFGFQSERRSYWEATEVYTRLSPFTYANRIKDPLLLIHGQADNNPGTYTVQSERFFQALQATGATARLVLLPHESHGYRSRESVLHVLAEMFDWADKYVKNRKRTVAEG